MVTKYEDIHKDSDVIRRVLLNAESGDTFAHLRSSSTTECFPLWHYTKLPGQRGLVHYSHTSLSYANTIWWLLGASAKPWYATISIVIFVCPSIRPSACNNSPPTGWILTKLDVRTFFENLSRKLNFVKIWLEYWVLYSRHTYIYANIWLNLLRIKCFWQEL